MTNGTRHGPLNWRPWAAIFVLVVLGIAAGGYGLYRFEAHRILLAKHQELASIGKMKSDAIKQWRQERLDDAANAVGSPFFQEATEALLKDSGNPARRDQYLGRLRLLQTTHHYSDAFLLAPDGRFLLADKDAPGPIDAATMKAIAEALESTQAVLSDLFRSPDGNVYIDTVAPVPDADSHPIAILVLRCDAKTFLYPLVQSWPIPSRSAETVLVRTDGDDVLFLSQLYHQAGAALSLRIPLTQSDVPAVQAVLGKVGIFEGKDYRGVEVLSDLAPVPDSPWFMVAKVDASEMLAEVNVYAAIALVFVLVLILLAMAATAFVYRRRQAGAYRDLYRAELEKRQAQEEQQAVLLSIAEAVIGSDAGGRVVLMNPVAEAITGWSHEEARGKPLHQVFQILNAETRERCENPVEKVLASGKTADLANHTTLIARDGPERPIAGSGAPLRDAEGRITGVALVFRDQSAELGAQREHLLLTNAVSASMDEIWLFDADTLRIRLVNRGALRNLGYSLEEIRQLTPLDLKPEFSAESFDALLQPLRTGEKPVQVFETTHRRADGSLYPVEVHLQMFDHLGERVFLSVIQDISERKQTAAAMKVALRLRQNMSDRSTLEVIEYGLEQAEALTQSAIAYFDYVNADQQSAQLLTWSRRTKETCVLPELVTHYPIEDAGVWVDCIRKRKPVVHNDYASLPQKKGLPEGHPPLVRDVGIPIFSDGRIVAILGVGNKPQDYSPQDVSVLSLIGETIGGVLHQRQTQDSLAQSHRAALSLLQDTQVQQRRAEAALERTAAAEHESTQRAEWAQGLQEAGQRLAACLTVEEVAECAAHAPVDYLHMKLAWVALPGKDGGMLPTVCSGPEAMSAMRDSPCMREAFANHTAIIVPDTVNAPRAGSWCTDWAREHGVGSCGTFPIMVKERCVAVLTVRDSGAKKDCRLVQAQPLIEIFCRQVGHVWRRCLDEEEKRKLALAVESSPATVVITDNAGRIEYVNPRFTETTGYTREEAIGGNPRTLKSGIHSTEFYQDLWRTLLAGREWRGEFCNKRKNGDLFWEHASISPMRDTRGRISHFVAVKEDITESKRMMEELAEAKAEAERANRAKSAFLANMSHEIRTPMNAILGYVQLLQRDKTLSRQQSEYLHTIARSGEYLLALINDILGMSKIEAGHAVLNSVTFDLPALLHDMETMFRVRTDAKMLWIEFRCLDEMPRYVQADESKVRQVLINLLGNAVKFTDAGRIVVRAWARHEEARDPAGQDGEHVRVVIEVEDTGCGIAPEDNDRVFVAFEQAQRVAARGGTGLGLSISRQYARLMGGDLTVKSQVGKGSLFRFEFQAVCSLEREILRASTQESVVGLAPGQKEVRVLVVDDRSENRDLLVRLLSETGFLTRGARDGLEAVAVFEAWHPHAILMDTLMPGVDGREATRRIKALPGGKETPVIAISASAMEEDRESALASGADGFIGKPFREVAIFEELRKLVHVNYAYATRAADARTAGIPFPAVSRESLAALPRDLRASMYEAVSEARMDEFLKLAGKTHEFDPVMSDLLRTLAKQFDYDTLLYLLRDEKGPPAVEQGEESHEDADCG